MGQNSLTLKENNTLNFQQALDQVVLFETAASLCSTWCQAIFLVGYSFFVM